MIKNHKKFFCSLWFWWLLLTVVYVCMTFVFFDEQFNSSIIGTPLGYMFGFIGIFVPYGVASFVLFYFPMTWISFVVFILVMLFAETKLGMMNLSSRRRVALNLLILLVLTITVDLIRDTPFESWDIFLKGGDLYQIPMFDVG